MGGSTWASTMRTRRRGTGSSTGPMADAIAVNGSMVDSMGRARLSLLQGLRDMESGAMARGSGGLERMTFENILFS